MVIPIFIGLPLARGPVPDIVLNIICNGILTGSILATCPNHWRRLSRWCAHCMSRTQEVLVSRSSARKAICKEKVEELEHIIGKQYEQAPHMWLQTPSVHAMWHILIITSVCFKILQVATVRELSGADSCISQQWSRPIASSCSGSIAPYPGCTGAHGWSHTGSSTWREKSPECRQVPPAFR